MLTWHVISVVILSLELFPLIKLKAYQIGMLLLVSTGVGGLWGNVDWRG